MDAVHFTVEDGLKLKIAIKFGLKLLRFFAVWSIFLPVVSFRHLPSDDSLLPLLACQHQPHQHACEDDHEGYASVSLLTYTLDIRDTCLNRMDHISINC